MKAWNSTLSAPQKRLERRTHLKTRAPMRKRSEQPRAQRIRALDKMAREIVMRLFGGKCAKCRSMVMIEIHHLVSKGSNPFLRWEMLNLLPLCHRHHGDAHGQHGQAFYEAFEEWLRENRPEHWQFREDHRGFAGDGPRDLDEVEATLKALYEQYT